MKKLKIMIIVFIILISICVGLFIEITNGINVHNIKYSNSFLSPDSIKIKCYCIKNYTVEMIEPSSPIYLGESKENDFSELGKNRFKVCIWDSTPSKNFIKKFKNSIVYSLPGNDDFKFIYINIPETHATEIYIGSNTSFSVDKQVVRDKEKIIETITIPIIYQKKTGDGGLK